ncbi:MAG: peptidoglycan DD-metalloendopeptidase family protein [Clostridia bacterium]|nr:peptidoglycan DD-metalloendopeptidase family protein [Clostridia bacterium]
MKNRIYDKTAAWKRIFSLVLCAVICFSLTPLSIYSVEENYDLPWLWPVPGSFSINCLDIYYGGGTHNQGQCVDIGANGYTGENRLDVVSATSGKVHYVVNKYSETGDRGSGYGNYVMILSGNVLVIYAHLQSVSCKYGDVIKAGDVIGKMGMTGNATGVHLHLQARLLGENYDSTTIYVFDKFTDNPLYYPRFKFMKGLSSSPRYGQLIKTYYQKSSGSYYAYSGGLSAEFETEPTDARVTVVTSSGAPVRSYPVKDNSYITDTIPRGEFVDVTGWFTDAYGELWLRTSSGGWIEESDTGFYTYNDSLRISEAVLPSGTVGGVHGGDVSGTVLSGHPISSVALTITSGGAKVWEKTFRQAEKTLSADLSALAAGAFTELELPDGDYTISVSAAVGSEYPGQDAYHAERAVASSDFTIDTGLADLIPPIIENVGLVSVLESGAEIAVVASDEREMDSVTVAVSFDGGEAEHLTCRADGEGRYVCSVSFQGPGDLVITATAKDASENTASLTRTVTIPETPDIADWKVIYKSGMNIRANPDPKSEKTGYADYGDILTIYEIVVVGNYTWGRLENGSYIALSYGSTVYLTRVESKVFSVFFDLNGGEGETPATISKTAGNDVVIPDSAPTRSGYVFAGWSADSLSKTAEYAPGATYSKDETVCLFAVWSDTDFPSVTEVTVTPSEWTSGPVTVTAQASDNTGAVYYSFDGGQTWLADGETVVRSNTSFPAGSIQVRDPYGNVTTYQSDFAVTNIDKTPPSVAQAATAVGVDGSRASITFGGVTDSESGIANVTAYLSHDPSLGSAVSFDITESGIITPGDGVWYGKLVFTDVVGNSSEVSLKRFAVGSVPKLPAPAGLRVTGAGSSFGDLEWNAVENGDGYEIEVSPSQSFDEPIQLVSDALRVSVSGLNSGITYYARVRAIASDGVYPPSDFTEPVSFATLSDDSSLYGFTNIDATINAGSRSADYVAPFSASSVDVRAEIQRNAKAGYYSDQQLETIVSDPSAYPFETDSATVYIKITAENGSFTVYQLRLRRAGEKAQTPVLDVDYDEIAAELLTGEYPGTATAIASVTDGGALSCSWYIAAEGGEPELIGQEDVVELSPLPAGVYELYCIAANINLKCLETVATTESDHITITVSKHVSPISAVVNSFTFTGEPATGAISNYIGDGDTYLKFYADAQLENEISAPSDAGSYWGVAFAGETPDWEAAGSAPVAFTIGKAENLDLPEYEITKPTPHNPVSTVTVTSENVEYSLNGAVWTPYTEPIVIGASDSAALRFAEGRNHLAGSQVTVSGGDYAGISDILASGSNSVTRDGDFLFIFETAAIDRSYIEAGIVMSEYIEITDAAGAVIPENGAVTSGCTVVLADDEGVAASVTVVVSGDVNGDGIIDYSDAKLALKYSNGTAEPETEWSAAAADADGDKTLTSTDALIISRWGYR